MCIIKAIQIEIGRLFEEHDFGLYSFGYDYSKFTVRVSMFKRTVYMTEENLLVKSIKTRMGPGYEQLLNNRLDIDLFREPYWNLFP